MMRCFSRRKWCTLVWDEEGIEWAKGEEPSSIGEVLSTMASQAEADGKISENRKALMTWMSINGDVERNHTVGAYVAPARRAEEAPVLCVFVDSKARAVDFYANREVYLARLDQAGLYFSEIRFEQSRYQKTSKAKKTTDPEVSFVHEPLTDEERDAIEEQIWQLPESLQEAVSRAVTASTGTPVGVLRKRP